MTRMSRALTPKTTLDTLKKDAKRWLKAVRAGDAKALARLAAAWPKAPAAPSLRDMQQALALEYGLADWKAVLAALADLALENQSRADRIEAVLRHGWDGDVLVARRIVERDPGIARANIFLAATCGEVEEVRRRLAADPNAALATGGTRAWTALAYCAYGRLDPDHGVEIARLLLDAGADPKFEFDDGWGNPFKVVTGAIGMGEGNKAVHPQADELVDLLVERGADPYDSQTLYNISIVGDDPHWHEVLWRHSEAGGRLDAWRVLGGQSLGGKRKLPTINYLLGNAVSHNHRNHAAWLLEHGADPDTPNAYSGQPVLTLARLSGFTEIAALLETHGANPAQLTGLEAFQAACLSGDEAAAPTMAAADPALLRHSGPLLNAAAFGKAEVVSLLLSLGASARATDHQGISPLHKAVQNGSLEIARRLLADGAEPDLRERSWHATPLGWASHLGRPAMATLLAPLSRDVRSLAELGFARRLEAVLREHPALVREVQAGEDAPTILFCLPDDEDEAAEIARVLMAFRPDTSVKGQNGWTAEKVARFRGLDEAADVIAGEG